MNTIEQLQERLQHLEELQGHEEVMDTFTSEGEALSKDTLEVQVALKEIFARLLTLSIKQTLYLNSLKKEDGLGIIPGTKIGTA